VSPSSFRFSRTAARMHRDSNGVEPWRGHVRRVSETTKVVHKVQVCSGEVCEDVGWRDGGREPVRCAREQARGVKVAGPRHSHARGRRTHRAACGRGRVC
jgi:hypothetical protein